MDKGMWRGNYGWSLRCASAAAAMTGMAVHEAATSSLGKGHVLDILRGYLCFLILHDTPM